jgi:hypothetical protein
MSKTEFYFFGCIDGPGHFMHAADGSPRRYYHDQPFGKLDGGLQPTGQEIQGRALVHHRDGWTAVSFWDRSVDKRGGCNGNFLANKTLSFDEMMVLAREHFPRVMARFPFEIVNVSSGDAPK